jgi:myo-inositol-1(or 4)-monophosphatase
LGSAALDLCWVACGRFDAFWEYYLNPWDLAAGLLIVREAGGSVTNFKGEQHIIFEPEMLASNGHIHADLLNELNS